MASLEVAVATLTRHARLIEATPHTQIQIVEVHRRIAVHGVGARLLYGTATLHAEIGAERGARAHVP